jgi:phage terminase small subunit
MKEKLTPKQKAFCEFYIETGNATEAAKKAGYKGQNLNRIGTENLSKLVIKEYLEKRINELDSKRIANADEVLEYLTKVMRGQEKDQFGLEIAIQDRTKAAELLGKRYRLFTDKVQVEGVLPVMIVGEDNLEE